MNCLFCKNEKLTFYDYPEVYCFYCKKCNFEITSKTKYHDIDNVYEIYCPFIDDNVVIKYLDSNEFVVYGEHKVLFKSKYVLTSYEQFYIDVIKIKENLIFI